jgi:hypothetical protein
MELKIFYRWPYLSFNEFHPSSAAWPLKKKNYVPSTVGTNIRIVFPMRGEKRREREREHVRASDPGVPPPVIT